MAPGRAWLVFRGRPAAPARTRERETCTCMARPHSCVSRMCLERFCGRNTCVAGEQCARWRRRQAFKTNVEPSAGSEGRAEGELVRAPDWWNGVFESKGLVDGSESRAGIGGTSAENVRVLDGDWLEGSGGDLQEGPVTTRIHAIKEDTRSMAAMPRARIGSLIWTESKHAWKPWKMDKHAAEDGQPKERLDE